MGADELTIAAETEWPGGPTVTMERATWVGGGGRSWIMAGLGAMVVGVITMGPWPEFVSTVGATDTRDGVIDCGSVGTAEDAGADDCGSDGPCGVGTDGGG